MMEKNPLNVHLVLILGWIVLLQVVVRANEAQFHSHSTSPPSHKSPTSFGNKTKISQSSTFPQQSINNMKCLLKVYLECRYHDHQRVEEIIICYERHIINCPER